MAGMLITNLMEERRKLIAESEKRGEKRGIKVGVINVAKEMIKKSIPIKTIEEITKLKEDELNKIQEELLAMDKSE